MLEHWHEFYLLLGTAAGTLVALLFVAASIGEGYLNTRRAGATRTFMSPVVMHYASVLFLSLVALAPDHTRMSLSLIAGVVAAAGAGYSLFVLTRVTRRTTDLPDRLCYGAGPALAYAAVMVAAWLFLSGSEAGPDVLAAALVLLLLVNIRNAWDLTLTMVRTHNSKKRG